MPAPDATQMQYRIALARYSLTVPWKDARSGETETKGDDH
jgi:hypothetical protein